MSAKFALPISRSICNGWIAIALFWLIVHCEVASAVDPLTVHEWGTFTALQDEQGRALGGINVDDEPLPDFVHDLNPQVVGRSYSFVNSLALLMSKGIPQRHPYVTLRLETPVIYFHLPPASPPMKLDVDVAIRGGWLTQFYPNADADAPGVKTVFDFGPITPQTVGRLAWKGLTVGTDASGPKTDQHVWAAPRNVQAASVTTGGKLHESEKYLFYRGVGNFAAPLEVATDAASDRIEIRGRFENVLAGSEHLTVGPLWLVQVQPDGRFAYRTLAPLEVTDDPAAIVGRARGSFAPGDFAFGNLDNLRHELRQALEREGLFPDEAAALIETWNEAYFRTPGWRLFFLVPRRWTDHYLPLSFSVPADLQRVMIGRIELISPEQRAGLKKLSEIAASDPSWTMQIYKSKNADKFFAGRSDFSQLGISIPADYQTYLDLGRFRNALILDTQRRHPTPNLAKFISAYDLSSFAVPGDQPVKH
jgi:hypothetical protein